MSATEAAEEAPREGKREYAGLGRRALAALIDTATWLVFYLFFIGGFVAAVYEESSEAAGVIVLVFLSAWFNYFSFAEWRWGQTIGKNATGIEVASLTGERVTFAQASMRNLLRLVDFFVVGWVMVASGASAWATRPRRPWSSAGRPRRARRRAGAGRWLGGHRDDGRRRGAASGHPAAPGRAPQSEAEGTAGARAFDWVTWRPGDVVMGILAAALISTSRP